MIKYYLYVLGTCSSSTILDSPFNFLVLLKNLISNMHHRSNIRSNLFQFVPIILQVLYLYFAEVVQCVARHFFSESYRVCSCLVLWSMCLCLLMFITICGRRKSLLTMVTTTGYDHDYQQTYCNYQECEQDPRLI